MLKVADRIAQEATVAIGGFHQNPFQGRVWPWPYLENFIVF
jgi:hypothetical protein